MITNNFSKTKKIVLSGIIVALYVVIMYFTSSFAFGAFQIRIATALYALSYAFPFLVVPLALANMLSNILSGQILDIIGGFIIGLITSGAVASVRLIKNKWGALFIIPIIVLLPGFVVPIWLTYILGVPYWVLVSSLVVGQITPAAVGFLLVAIIMPRIKNMKVYFPGKRKISAVKADCVLSDVNETSNATIEYMEQISRINAKRNFDDEADNSDNSNTEEIL
jgi:uncharacterized membrane protein